MKIRTLLIVAALFLGADANAQQCGNPYQLKGFTTAALTGGSGVLGFTAACQAQFGAGARMCTSVEVMETVVIPPGLSGTACLIAP